MLREGRQIEKNMCTYEKIRLLLNQFFIENPLKIHQKIKKNDICHENRQTSIPQSILFSQKIDFQWFGGTQGGPQNC